MLALLKQSFHLLNFLKNLTFLMAKYFEETLLNTLLKQFLVEFGREGLEKCLIRPC